MAKRRRFTVDPDICRASTRPAWICSDPEGFALQRERVFAKSWQLVADLERVKVPGQVLPVTFLEGMLEEPLLLPRDADDWLHCVSNVCTHRGNLVCESAGLEQGLRCRYHGRRFALDGRFVSMPEFETAESFPSSADDLGSVHLGV